MLGQDAVDLLRRTGHDVLATGRDTLDVTDPAACLDVVQAGDVVLNCAGWTAVDDAETHEAEAFAANAVGPANLARATAARGALLVHVSTDYVFDGAGSQPYAEDDPCAPRSAYGRTKLAGEWAVRALDPTALILRTAWLYGAHGACFPKTMARLASQRDRLDVVADQCGQPTWTADVAALALALVGADAPGGIYHATSSGSATWFDFARAAVAAAGHDPGIVHPTTSAAYPRPAARPSWSVLGHTTVTALGLEPIGPWQDRWAEAGKAVLADAG